MTIARLVSLNRISDRLISGGTPIRKACGSMTWRIAPTAPRPMARAASSCVPGMARRPERMSSHMNALTFRARATMPNMNSVSPLFSHRRRPSGSTCGMPKYHTMIWTTVGTLRWYSTNAVTTACSGRHGTARNPTRTSATAKPNSQAPANSRTVVATPWTSIDP
jgi:hypothetical protein